MHDTRLTRFAQKRPELGAAFALLLVLACNVLGALIDNEQLWSNL
jgi:UPF0716 family protein affecting phage T7 exclusion